MSLSRLFHSYRDELIGRWGKTGVPRETHLTHPQAEHGLSHMWPVRASNLHQSQRWDDRMIKSAEIQRPYPLGINQIDCIVRFLWPCRLTSYDKANSILLKGCLVNCNQSGLSAFSVIIHQAAQKNIRCATLWEKPIYKHGSTGRIQKINNTSKPIHLNKRGVRIYIHVNKSI